MFFFITLFVLITLITIIELCHYYGDNCGIPLHLWLDIYFIIVFSKYLIFDWVDILICKYKPTYWYDTECFKIFLVFSAITAWIIYGYILYFSDQNDCQNHTETTIMLLFMIYILFMGSFLILVFLVLLFSAPWWYCKFREIFMSIMRGGGDIDGE